MMSALSTGDKPLAEGTTVLPERGIDGLTIVPRSRLRRENPNGQH